MADEESMDWWGASVFTTKRIEHFDGFPIRCRLHLSMLLVREVCYCDVSRINVSSITTVYRLCSVTQRERGRWLYFRV